MKLNVSITGQMPRLWREALTELRDDLGFVLSENGVSVRCRKGDGITVRCDGASVELTWGADVEFYRALSLIPVPLCACDIHEKANFKSAGPMFDCSRNGVVNPDAMRFFIRKMALMGLNLGMLYTEDTYEVPGRPFFGYKRGRYTYDELKALDDYAALFGVELCPCIQTLGHLKMILHWPAFTHLRDHDDVLLADLPETYVLLEEMIRAATAPYRSKKIHLGMDEAFGVGLGAHYYRFGHEDPKAVMGRHLKTVLDICGKYELEPMIWSDMYFHLDGRDYHSEGLPSVTAKAAVDRRVTLVYWDYYQDEEAKYADALYKHAQFPAPTVFAGGLWTWTGPAPSYPTAFANTIAGLTACRKANVPLVLATAWGDNGQECSMYAALLGLQLYGELTYRDSYDEAELFARFRRCCHADPKAFLDLSLFNYLPGMAVGKSGNPANVGKVLLYQDPLIQLFEDDLAGYPISAHYESLVGKFARHAAENPEYPELFNFYTAMAHMLALKSRWHEQAGPIVRTGDRERAAALCEDVSAIIDAIHALRTAWRTLWEKTNKPHGFEVIEVRLGGVAARFATAGEKMRAFAAGEADTIPELLEECLPLSRYEDNHFSCTNVMGMISTASKIDW